MYGEELMTTMKTSLLALFFLWGTTALAQSANYLPNEPVVLRLPSHPEHASRQPMGEIHYLTEAGYGYTYAQGERPLWDVASVSNPVPLGDVERMLRKQHENARKANIVWNN